MGDSEYQPELKSGTETQYHAHQAHAATMNCDFYRDNIGTVLSLYCIVLLYAYYVYVKNILCSERSQLGLPIGPDIKDQLLI